MKPRTNTHKKFLLLSLLFLLMLLMLILQIELHSLVSRNHEDAINFVDVGNVLASSIANGGSSVNIDDFNNTVSKITELPDLGITNRTIYLMHVGKSGGESVSTSLSAHCEWYMRPQRKRQCYEALGDEDTAFNRHVKCVQHGFVRNQTWLEKSTSVLFYLRNPVSRFISAYNFAMNNGKLNDSYVLRHLYQECFPSLHNLTSIMNATDHVSHHRKCHYRGKFLFEGRIQSVAHTHYNLKHYYKSMLHFQKSKEILVIRTEHLWDDIVSLDVLLGGDGLFEHYGTHETHVATEKKIMKESLDDFTKSEKVTFCCWLHSEYEVYLDIMSLAVNLDDQQKYEALKDSFYDQCNAVFIDLKVASIKDSFRTWKQNVCANNYLAIF